MFPKVPNTKSMDAHKQPITLLLLFISSLLLNACLFYKIDDITKNTKVELTWSLKAAAEAEAVAENKCSGHGRVFLDGLIVDGGPKCECNTCYTGSDCSLLNSDCSADADGGDPVFLEAYWQKHASNGAAVLVSGWHRMSYKTTGENFISIELEKNIRLIHEAVGNAVAENKFIVFGTGSTQLINALVYALSPDYSSNASIPPAKVVASVPYYPVYKLQTSIFDAKEYEWEGITKEWVNTNSSDSSFIEFVTSPNNPDGRLQHSILKNSSVIYDRCYYWPLYTAIPKAADEDVMMFSFSKMSGHASSRFGWVLVKDKKVYEKVSKYIQLNSMGVSRDTQLRMLTIIKVILSNIKEQSDIFDFGYNTMKAKWSRLNNLVSSSSRFSLQHFSPEYCNYFQRVRDPSPAYGWLKCEREEDKDCEAVLRNGGIISRSGIFYEAGSKYTRLSLIKTQDDFELLMQKMEAIISKQDISASI